MCHVQKPKCFRSMQTPTPVDPMHRQDETYTNSWKLKHQRPCIDYLVQNRPMYNLCRWPIPNYARNSHNRGSPCYVSQTADIAEYWQKGLPCVESCELNMQSSADKACSKAAQDWLLGSEHAQHCVVWSAHSSCPSRKLQPLNLLAIDKLYFQHSIHWNPRNACARQ